MEATEWEELKDHKVKLDMFKCRCVITHCIYNYATEVNVYQ